VSSSSRQARRLALGVICLLGLVAGACDREGTERNEPAYPLDDTLRLHEVQVLNTHNSYHRRSPVALPQGLKDPVDYEHPPLDEQLEGQGVRGFELDVFNAPDGLPVAHTPVVDAETNCTPFEACLRVIKAWSDRRPGHVPIFVLVEPKNQTIVLEPLYTNFDLAALQRLDSAVNSVFAPEDLVTPDDVRGGAATLRQRVVEDGWPTLRRVRGKVVMVLNTGEPERALYLEGRPSLEGAPMFVTAEEAAPSAAVIKVDDPDERRIQRLVRDHFIVRTRADADVIEARTNDTTRRDLALRTGAQIVSTDFPLPDPAISAEYSVQIPDGRPGRCNPVQAPRDCRPLDVENPRHLTERR
jgi:Phosphoinositide phospholipase C, Ca2+-dependent